MSLEPIIIRVFIHNDLADRNKNDLYKTYFAELALELESISGRETSILLISPPNAGLHNHHYKDRDPSESLGEWQAKVDNYRRALPEGCDSSRYNKYLLLTRDILTPTTAGIAHRPGYTGIASVVKTSTPAHEVGHMFNATHKDSDVLYTGGWWKETNMRTDGFSQLRGNVNRFSDKNRENIRQYLDDFELHDFAMAGCPEDNE